MHISFFRVLNDETTLQKLGFKRYSRWDSETSQMWRLDHDGKIYIAHEVDYNGPKYVQIAQVKEKGESFITVGAFGWKDCCSEGSVENYIGFNPLEISQYEFVTPNPVADSSTYAP